jgi:8-hydroxy-5-deazaflavin:NADPH oxidoreductase
MRIGIIGAGHMGSAFAKRLSATNHEVCITSRNLDEANSVASSVGGNVRAVPQQQLASNADVLIAATPFPEQAEAIRATGSIEGKTVIEISNPLKHDMSGLAIGHSTSAAEEVAKALPNAKIVKAFNTIFAQVLTDAPKSGSTKVQVFYAGDDAGAKGSARSLIESMGFEPIDAGPLTNARLLEPLGMLNIYFGYVAKMGTDVAPSVKKIASQNLADVRVESSTTRPPGESTVRSENTETQKSPS